MASDKINHRYWFSELNWSCANNNHQATTTATTITTENIWNSIVCWPLSVARNRETNLCVYEHVYYYGKKEKIEDIYRCALTTFPCWLPIQTIHTQPSREMLSKAINIIHTTIYTAKLNIRMKRSSIRDRWLAPASNIVIEMSQSPFDNRILGTLCAFLANHMVRCSNELVECGNDEERESQKIMTYLISWRDFENINN